MRGATQEIDLHQSYKRLLAVVGRVWEAPFSLAVDHVFVERRPVLGDALLPAVVLAPEGVCKADEPLEQLEAREEVAVLVVQRALARRLEQQAVGGICVGVRGPYPLLPGRLEDLPERMVLLVQLVVVGVRQAGAASGPAHGHVGYDRQGVARGQRVFTDLAVFRRLGSQIEGGL